MDLDDEQRRQLINARQFYETWREISAALSQMPGGMYWRVIHSKEYLYRYVTTAGIKRATSLGPKTPEAEAKYQQFTETKDELEDRLEAIEERLNRLAPVLRALNLPAIDSTAGKILRALDQVNFLGTKVLVVGTYAMSAYEIVAQNRFATGMDTTEDLDFTLTAEPASADPDLPRQLLLALKQVDSSFLVSRTSPKTIVNKAGYRVDLLMSDEAAAAMRSAKPWKPEALPGQEWLRLGPPARALLIDYTGWPVPITAPDPRYFALHKLWLSGRADRDRDKSIKDRKQGEVLLGAVKQYMPHYSIDEQFIAGLPPPLKAQL